jgi:hypothetical protein
MRTAIKGFVGVIIEMDRAPAGRREGMLSEPLAMPFPARKFVNEPEGRK